MITRDVIFPPGRQALYERNRYSPAIRSNGFLFVSGQVCVDPQCKLIAMVKLGAGVTL